MKKENDTTFWVKSMAQFACLRDKIHEILLNVGLQFMKLPPPLITTPNEMLQWTMWTLQPRWMNTDVKNDH